MTAQTETSTNAAGWGWFLRYVIAMTLITGAIRGFQQWLLVDPPQNSLIFPVLAGASLLIVITQAFVLPPPLSQDKFMWLGLSLLGSLIISFIIFPLVARVLVTQLLSDSITTGQYAVTNTIINIAVGTIIIGTMQWLVLRRHVKLAVLWYGVLLFADIVQIPANVFQGYIVGNLRFQEVSVDTIQGTVALLSFLPAFGTALITGVALWYLVVRQPVDRAVTPDPGFRFDD